MLFSAFFLWVTRSLLFSFVRFLPSAKVLSMDAPSAAPKTTVLVLLRQEVPEDTPPTRKAPEPLCLVVYPRLLAFLRESYPDEVKVIAGASLESFLKRKEEVEQVRDHSYKEVE